QMVDPEVELEGQMMVVNTLQGKLAEARIERELLETEQRTGAKADIRQGVKVAEADRRINVLERRLQQERQKFGIADAGLAGEGYAPLVAEFERLSLDREYAEQTYLSAFSAYNNALAEAQRQSRYLAAYERPTLSQKAEYPQRPTLVALTTLFLLLGWSILSLIYYSLRERR
ncbi:MAG TPA: sugar transporter, partial [Thermohalobaculum sp.]|nr:sugar transporter [Thermohalobaculum sp.]